MQAAFDALLAEAHPELAAELHQERLAAEAARSSRQHLSQPLLDAELSWQQDQWSGQEGGPAAESRPAAAAAAGSRKRRGAAVKRKLAEHVAALAVQEHHMLRQAGPGGAVLGAAFSKRPCAAGSAASLSSCQQVQQQGSPAQVQSTEAAPASGSPQHQDATAAAAAAFQPVSTAQQPAGGDVAPGSQQAAAATSSRCQQMLQADVDVPVSRAGSSEHKEPAAALAQGPAPQPAAGAGAGAEADAQPGVDAVGLPRLWDDMSPFTFEPLTSAQLLGPGEAGDGEAADILSSLLSLPQEGQQTFPWLTQQEPLGAQQLHGQQGAAAAYGVAGAAALQPSGSPVPPLFSIMQQQQALLPASMAHTLRALQDEEIMDLQQLPWMQQHMASAMQPALPHPRQQHERTTSPAPPQQQPVLGKLSLSVLSEPAPIPSSLITPGSFALPMPPSYREQCSPAGQAAQQQQEQQQQQQMLALQQGEQQQPCSSSGKVAQLCSALLGPVKALLHTSVAAGAAADDGSILAAVLEGAEAGLLPLVPALQPVLLLLMQQAAPAKPVP